MQCSKLLRFLLAAIVALGALPALAGTLGDLAVVDISTGERLTVYQHGGRHYVAGAPGRRYAVEVRNRTEGRVLAVVSVDGVNVVSGETAMPAQSGYVLAPWQQLHIAGWRKNLDEVAAFYFTAVPDSYAARTGRPRNVGVVGVALFREAPSAASGLSGGRFEERSAAESPEDAPAAPAAKAQGRGKASAPTQAAEASASEAEPRPRNGEQSRADASSAGGALQRQAEANRAARLGTGHGERLASQAERTTFRRATEAPEETLVIYYDSRANLIARGVIPTPAPTRTPEPFPGGFVPDPRG
jgi:pyruvate/2-oxoglutarate dehydrogenase complex dihydrolipoamide acyltransferase (E2) component